MSRRDDDEKAVNGAVRPAAERLGDHAREWHAGELLAAFGGHGLVTALEHADARLCATEKAPRVLHGDLHHDNVLFDADLGWVAIDPWGAIGELEFEIAASLRNPYELTGLTASRTALAIDLRRALEWAFAHAILAALWPVDDGVGVDFRSGLVKAALKMREMLS